MRRYAIRHKGITVWLLAAILAFPLTMKSAHIHHCEGSHAAAAASHDCNDCLICQFELYAYTETSLLKLTPQLTPGHFIPAPEREKTYTLPYLPHSPRAPPCQGHRPTP
ncbi:MAG: hypothetical protein LBK65_10125 [Tannerellaceae bacterium]|nr:hypothetical protein [Tannerellaceae bacterium]